MYFGGKRRIADVVWREFGAVGNYIEPFFGSGAVLLARSGGASGVETVNDADGMLANMWRAVQADPDGVARWADNPVNECDLHARHLWLVGQRDDLTARLMADPDWHDAKAAGWWLWGICCWIGGGWCSGKGPWQAVGGELVKGARIGTGMGINKNLPYMSRTGMGINKKLPHMGNAGRGAFIHDWMRELSERLRDVRVACGDWSRVCGPSVLRPGGGAIGVFLDPPYSHDVRDGKLYAIESADVSAQVRAWAIEQGSAPRVRIALCGYDNEHGGQMPDGWRAHAWKATGGYGSRGRGEARGNASREVVWFSPHCTGGGAQQGGLF